MNVPLPQRTNVKRACMMMSTGREQKKIVRSSRPKKRKLGPIIKEYFYDFATKFTDVQV